MSQDVEVLKAHNGGLSDTVNSLPNEVAQLGVKNAELSTSLSSQSDLTENVYHEVEELKLVKAELEGAVASLSTEVNALKAVGDHTKPAPDG
jgi:cell division protein FtsB